jgi:hypothetical protein
MCVGRPDTEEIQAGENRREERRMLCCEDPPPSARSLFRRAGDRAGATMQVGVVPELVTGRPYLSRSPAATAAPLSRQVSPAIGWRSKLKLVTFWQP